MTPSLAVVLLGAVIFWAGATIRAELRARRRERAIQQAIRTYARALADAQDDPRRLLVWHRLAEIERRLLPQVFAELDSAAKARFPFSKAAIESAHARWTAEWLTWERTHDAEYKLRVAALEDEAERAGDARSPVARARIEAVEREKLERYQQRYEEYVRVAKGLAALEGPEATGERV